MQSKVFLKNEVKPVLPDIRKKRIARRKADTVRVERKQELGDHTTRYHLTNGWFIDHETVAACTEYGEPYEVFIPGASETGGARCITFSRTLKGALRQVNSKNKPVNISLF